MAAPPAGSAGWARSCVAAVVGSDVASPWADAAASDAGAAGASGDADIWEGADGLADGCCAVVLSAGGLAICGTAAAGAVASGLVIGVAVMVSGDTLGAVTAAAGGEVVGDTS
ncbi:hypothetical protein [Hyphomicrobium sp. 1Nfss2.1]|uniref:hypothetical protein n=1 Tax=Hyphomicrobium sp. 1Nfss2.1 TaxID=3413936 RepID=UPI003C7BE81E